MAKKEYFVILLPNNHVKNGDQVKRNGRKHCHLVVAIYFSIITTGNQVVKYHQAPLGTARHR
jgi:hypothetical protein